MYRIIDDRSTGKTSRLMLLAKEHNAVIACSNPRAMQTKAYGYGITGLRFISYYELINYPGEHEKYFIDEIEDFIKYIITHNKEFLGYTLSID